MTYSCTFENITVSAIQDLFELTVPTDAVALLHSVRVGQESEEGDAAAEMLDIAIVTGEGSVTGGSGGAAGTEEGLQTGFAAPGTAVEVNNTTRMAVGTGSLHTILADSFNVQVGWLYQPTPEERIAVSPGNLLTVALPVAPADATEMSGTIVWEEIGG